MLLFFFEAFTPEKRNASIGDTLLAILDGFMLLINAVMNENNPAPMKIKGEYDGDMALSIIVSPAKARIPKEPLRIQLPHLMSSLKVYPKSSIPGLGDKQLSSFAVR